MTVRIVTVQSLFSLESVLDDSLLDSDRDSEIDQFTYEKIEQKFQIAWITSITRYLYQKFKIQDSFLSFLSIIKDHKTLNIDSVKLTLMQQFLIMMNWKLNHDHDADILDVDVIFI